MRAFLTCRVEEKAALLLRALIELRPSLPHFLFCRMPFLSMVEKLDFDPHRCVSKHFSPNWRDSKTSLCLPIKAVGLRRLLHSAVLLLLELTDESAFLCLFPCLAVPSGFIVIKHN